MGGFLNSPYLGRRLDSSIFSQRTWSLWQDCKLIGISTICFELLPDRAVDRIATLSKTELWNDDQRIVMPYDMLTTVATHHRSQKLPTQILIIQLICIVAMDFVTSRIRETMVRGFGAYRIIAWSVRGPFSSIRHPRTSGMRLNLRVLSPAIWNRDVISFQNRTVTVFKASNIVHAQPSIDTCFIQHTHS